MKHDHHSPKGKDYVELPTPTAWPIVTAFGLTLFFAGFVTDITFAIAGIIVGIGGGIGWCLDLFPHPKHEPVPLRPKEEHPEPIRTVGRVVRILDVGKTHRARIPVEVHPYTAGAFGGLVGAVVMAAMACLYGIFKYGSIWYPINLLAAAGVPELAGASLETLRQFSFTGLVVGTLAHISISILVGLLYAVLLPMLPARFEWLWGGIITPLIWTALIFASLRVINPKLAIAIDWPWFIFCQVAFGAVCGYVVFKSAKVETQQSWSVAERLGVEAQHKEEDHA
jgi:hypothetical protein